MQPKDALLKEDESHDGQRCIVFADYPGAEAGKVPIQKCIPLTLPENCPQTRHVVRDCKTLILIFTIVLPHPSYILETYTLQFRYIFIYVSYTQTSNDI